MELLPIRLCSSDAGVRREQRAWAVVACLPVAMALRVVSTMVEWAGALDAAGGKLVVAYFSAPASQPCHRIRPIVEALASKNRSVVFVEVRTQHLHAVMAHGLGLMSPVAGAFHFGSRAEHEATRWVLEIGRLHANHVVTTLPACTVALLQLPGTRPSCCS